MDDNETTTEQLIKELAASQKRVARLEALVEISRTLSSTLRFQDILTEVARLCCQAFDTTSAYVGTIDDEAGTTMVVAEYFSQSATPGETVSDMGISYDMQTHFPMLATWSTSPKKHFAIHLDDPAGKHPVEVRHLREYDTKSALVVPLTAGEEFTGYIEIWESRHKRDFTADEIELLQLVAGQVSVFLANAHLYEELRASEDRYRVVSELVADYAFRYKLNSDGTWRRIWTTDEAFKRLTGYGREDLGASYDLYHPDEYERVKQDVELTLNGVSVEGEYRIITKQGQDRWIYVRRQPEWDDAGQRIIGFYGAAQDITARKELEIDLAYHAGLLHNVSDAVISADANWEIKTWNNGAEAMYGWTAQEAIGHNAVELFQTEYDDGNTPEQAAMDFQKTGIWQGEAWHRRKDGQRIPVYISSSYVRDSAGAIIGTVTIIRDITIQKRSEMQRMDMAVQEERIQLLEELIADLSHDIKTPLTSINSFLYLLRRNPDRDKQKGYLDRMENQVERLTTLLDDILTISRLEKGAELTFAPVYLNDMLQAIHAQYHHVQKAKHLRLSLDLDADIPPIFGNETEMSRALANLLVNAINYTPDGGSILVTTAQTRTTVTVEVRDTGIGIVAEELPRIFDRFYRSDKARNTTQGGTGLGLAIVKRIIELHGGTIIATSNPGSGSIFTVTLPISPLRISPPHP